MGSQEGPFFADIFIIFCIVFGLLGGRLRRWNSPLAWAAGGVCGGGWWVWVGGDGKMGKFSLTLSAKIGYND
jgi:hypothetical protein